MLAIVGAAALYYYRKSKGSAAYNDMLALAAQYIPGGFPQWLIDNANAGRIANLTNDYKVNGKVTDYGKLLAAYAQQYHGRGYKYNSGSGLAPNTGDEKSLNDALYQRFYQEKNK